MKTALFCLTLCVLALLYVVPVVKAAGCNQQCANNNECTTSTCSRCALGTCQAGLPCGASCSVDTDCYALGSCPLCQNRFCGGSPAITASPTPSRSPYPPAPSSSATPSPSPYPSASRSPYPAPTPAPVQPSSVKVCAEVPNDDYYSQCGPDNFVVVEGNWTAYDCAKLATTQGYNDFALACLTQTGLTIGSNRKPPTNDCGWVHGGNVVPAKNETKICSLVYSTYSCSGIYATTTVGDGWSTKQCQLFTQQLLTYAPSYAYSTGYQLGCTYDFYSGSFSLGSTYGSIPSIDCGWAHPPIYPTNSNFNTTKVCGVVYAGQSEVGILNVLDTWNGYDCRSYSLSRGGSNFFLGCIFFNSFSLGQVGGFTPSYNCGW